MEKAKLYSLRHKQHVDDGREFLPEAARLPVSTHVQTFGFDQVNDALIALQHDAIRSAGVIINTGKF